MLAPATSAARQLHLTDRDVAIQLPCRLLLAAPSGAGKSSLVLNLIRERARVFSHPLTAIIYCFSDKTSSNLDEKFKTDLQAAFPEIVFHVGICDFSEITFLPGHKLVVLDDLAHKIVKNEAIFDVVTTASRHNNVSLFFCTQNLFQSGSYAKALSRNCTGKIIWNDLADAQWISILNRQVLPRHPNFLSQVMTWLDLNIKDYYNQYVLLDATRKTKLPLNMRIRTNILPQKDGSIQPIFFSPTT